VVDGHVGGTGLIGAKTGCLAEAKQFLLVQVWVL